MNQEANADPLSGVTTKQLWAQTSEWMKYYKDRCNSLSAEDRAAGDVYRECAAVVRSILSPLMKHADQPPKPEQPAGEYTLESLADEFCKRRYQAVEKLDYPEAAAWRDAEVMLREFIKRRPAEDSEGLRRELEEAKKTIQQQVEDWAEVDDALERAGVTMNLDGYRKSQVDAVAELSALKQQGEGEKTLRLIAELPTNVSHGDAHRNLSQAVFSARAVIGNLRLPSPAPAAEGKAGCSCRMDGNHGVDATRSPIHSRKAMSERAAEGVIQPPAGPEGDKLAREYLAAQQGAAKRLSDKIIAALNEFSKGVRDGTYDHIFAEREGR